MTGRAAARALSGVVGSDEQARILLRAGACGPGLRAGGVVLYDDGPVLQLAQRPFVDDGHLVGACPHGLYVARLARTLPLDLSLPWERVGAQVRELPAMPWLTAGLLVGRVGLFGRLPWVATLCGLVVHGAELTGFDDVPGEGRSSGWSDRARGSSTWSAAGSRWAAVGGPGGSGTHRVWPRPDSVRG